VRVAAGGNGRTPLTHRWLALALVSLALARTAPAQEPVRLQQLLKEGFQLLDSGKPEQAQPRLELARALAHDAGDIGSEAEADRGLGLVLQAGKDFAGARTDLEKALELYASINDRRGAGSVRSNLGLLATTLGNWPDVRTFFTAAADDYAAVGDPALQAGALYNLVRAGDLSDARRIELLNQAWELVQSTGDTRRQGLILHRWGDVLTMQGEYGAALDKLEAAMALLERVGAPLEIAGVTTSLGRAHRLHGLPEQAMAFYQKALDLSEKAGDQRYIAQSLGALTVGLEALGRYDEGLVFARRAFALARASGNRPQIYNSLGNLAGLHIDSGQYAEALALLEAYVTTADDPALALESVDLRRELSEAYAGLGRFDEALREADGAVRLGEVEQRPEPLLRALAQRARVRMSRGDPAGAFEDAERALGLVERLRATLPARDFLKQGYGDSYQALFTLAIELRVRQGDADGALAVAEQARARAFQDLLASREQTGRPIGSEPPVSPSRGPESAALAGAPTVAELRAIAGRLHSPLLCYWVGPRTTFILVVPTAGPIEARSVAVDATRLERLVAAAASGPAAPDVRSTGPPVTTRGGVHLVLSPRGRELRELYDLLIKPVLPVLDRDPGKRLTIVPHGPLFRVSFAALRDERGRYLIERYELNYAPAAGVLRFTGQQRHHDAIRSSLLVADPATPAVPRSRDALPPLAGARLEVADAARLVGGRTAILVGARATKARVRSLVAGRDLLHFATHGIITDRDPLDSYLALARSPGGGTGDDRLTAAEIYSLDVGADLVVLSACRSGAGRITGDGIIGLSRGFFYAGAPTVLATLWDLADEPGRYLMRRFYTAWRKGATKAAALRRAQLDVIRALRAGKISVTTPFGAVVLPEHPALWAPFVLLGEP
jgi:CHAT domain-containing protein/tetratricopeptide (TPR) repeat protein